MHPSIYLRHHRQGFTLIEMMVVVAIISFVWMAVAALLVTTSRVSMNLRALTASQSQVFLALNHVRYQLCMGAAGQTTISEDGRRIDFRNPNLGNARSSFLFENGDLLHDADINNGSGYETRVQGLVDMRFSMLPGNAVVRVRARSIATTSFNRRVPIENEIFVFLRN